MLECFFSNIFFKTHSRHQSFSGQITNLRNCRKIGKLALNLIRPCNIYAHTVFVYLFADLTIMVTPDSAISNLEKKRRMRNSRKKRKRQQRAAIKRAVSKAVLQQKINDGVNEQKKLAEEYRRKWRQLCREANELRRKIPIQSHSRKVNFIETSHTQSLVLGSMLTVGISDPSYLQICLPQLFFDCYAECGPVFLLLSLGRSHEHYSRTRTLSQICCVFLYYGYVKYSLC